HPHQVGLVANDLLGERLGSTAGGNVEQFGKVAVGAEIRGQHSRVTARLVALQHCCARTIAEQDNGRAILAIGDGGELLAANDKDRASLPGGDQSFGHRERVDPTRAGRHEVERPRALGTERGLDIAGHGGQTSIGGDSGEDDPVDLAGRDAGIAHGVLRCYEGVVEQLLIGASDAALTNAGALDDPFIGSVEVALEVGIGQHAVGNRCSDPGYPGYGASRDHAAGGAACPANSSAMCSLSPACTDSTALRMAFLMADGLDEPWQMIGTPRTPSNGAPPYWL